MKTSVIEVRNMLSVWSVVGVEERIGKVPGVESVTVNFAAGSATVRYDETRLKVADIKTAVRQSGYESDASAGAGHEGYAAPGAAAPKPAPEPPAPTPAPAPAAPKPAAPAAKQPADNVASDKS